MFSVLLSFNIKNKTNKTIYFQGELFWGVGGDQTDSLFCWKNKIK